ncbi:MAG: nuclear transport factor 2 family protein [Ferruginibacter sp.]
MREDAVFMGTDATERWTKPEFMKWAKPFFDRGKAWDFTAVKREIFLDGTGNMAWFDELLSTQMKLCRGSGVLVKQGGNWKISQYVLSATVPNTILDTVVVMKTAEEDSLLRVIKK